MGGRSPERELRVPHRRGPCLVNAWHGIWRPEPAHRFHPSLSLPRRQLQSSVGLTSASDHLRRNTTRLLSHSRIQCCQLKYLSCLPLRTCKSKYSYQGDSWEFFTFSTQLISTCHSTISPNCIVRLWSCNNAVANIFSHKVEPFCETRSWQYLLGR